MFTCVPGRTRLTRLRPTPPTLPRPPASPLVDAPSHRSIHLCLLLAAEVAFSTRPAHHLNDNRFTPSVRDVIRGYQRDPQLRGPVTMASLHLVEGVFFIEARGTLRAGGRCLAFTAACLPHDRAPGGWKIHAFRVLGAAPKARG